MHAPSNDSLVCVCMCVCVQLKAITRDLQNLYFSRNQETTRKVAAELNAIVSSVEEACISHEKGLVSHL